MGSSKQRLLSLDVMRGITIAAMILVNSPGSYTNRYSQLAHADWHGLTFADLIFPFFLYMVGVSVALGIPKLRKFNRSEAVYKIVKRGFLLCLIGYLVHAFPLFDFFNTARIPGVLQRIGAAYVIASLLCLYLSNRSIVFVSVSILFGYWSLLYVTSDDPFSLSGNITSVFDIYIFGESFIYSGYGTPFDPEGFLSTFPSVVTVLIGVLSGYMISSSQSLGDKLKGLVVLGLAMLVAGIWWGHYFPINKSLWSSSYVLVSGSISILFLAFLTWLIDVKKCSKYSWIFVVYGSNALFAYCVSEVINISKHKIVISAGGDSSVSLHQWLYHEIFQAFFGNYFGSLMYAVFFVSIIWFFMYQLYRKDILIKI